MGINCCRGVGTIERTVGEVFFFASQGERRGEWDEMYTGGRELEEYSDFCRARHLAFKGQFTVSPRDLCVLNGAKVDYQRRELLAIGVSITHPDCPEVKGHVRAELHPSGFLLQPHPNNPDHTLVTYVVKSDLKGWIPGSIKNMVAERQPLCIARIRDVMLAE